MHVHPALEYKTQNNKYIEKYIALSCQACKSSQKRPAHLTRCCNLYAYMDAAPRPPIQHMAPRLAPRGPPYSTMGSRPPLGMTARPLMQPIRPYQARPLQAPISRPAPPPAPLPAPKPYPFKREIGSIACGRFTVDVKYVRGSTRVLLVLAVTSLM